MNLVQNKIPNSRYFLVLVRHIKKQIIFKCKINAGIQPKGHSQV